MEKKVRRILTAGSVLVIPLSISFPTVSCVTNRNHNCDITLYYTTQGVFMYWIPNTLLVTVQMLLLKRPAFRTALGIPLIERKRDKP